MSDVVAVGCVSPRSTSSVQQALRGVRLVEPFGAGGGPDVVARAIAGPLAERWGRSVDVENHPGGGSTAAPEFVAKAPADGGVLLVNTSAHAYSAVAAPSLRYHPLLDFVAVTPLTSQAYVVVAGRHTGVSRLTELIEAAKAKPGEMTFGSTGVGTATHIGTLEMNLAVGISTVHVPAGPSDAISDVISKVVAGAVDYVMAPISMASGHLADDTLAALGVTSAQRSPILIDVPTLKEAGIPGYEFPIWYGVRAPTDIPMELVDQLAADITWAIARGDWLVSHGMEPMSITPDAFVGFVAGEARRAERIIKASLAER